MSTFNRRTRHAVLTAHIAVSVALLGDVAALVAVAGRAMGEDDPDAAHTMYEILSMFSMAFGIPLSLAAIATGVALGVGTRWGVFRYGWVIAKLVLIVGVMAIGALVVGPAEERLITESATGSDRSQTEWTIVIAAITQGAALLTATGLGVSKPRRRGS